MAKTKALISFAVIPKLICVFVFAYAKCWFSHDAAQFIITLSLSGSKMSSMKVVFTNSRYSPIQGHCGNPCLCQTSLIIIIVTCVTLKLVSISLVTWVDKACDSKPISARCHEPISAGMYTHIGLPEGKYGTTGLICLVTRQ